MITLTCQTTLLGNQTTPLHIATHFHNPDMIELLLTNNANLKATAQAKRPDEIETNDKSDNILAQKVKELTNAIKDNKIDIVKQFAQQNIGWLTLPLNEANQTALHLAAESNQTDIIKLIAKMLKQEKDKRHIEVIGRMDAYDMTPLQYVAFNNNKEAYNALTQNNVDAQQAADANKLAINIAQKECDYLIKTIQRLPNAVHQLDNETTRDLITNAQQVIDLVNANYEAADYLLEDERIRILVQSCESSIGQLISSLPQHMLLRHDETLISMIHGSQQEGGLFGRLAECWSSRKYSGFFQRIGAFFSNDYKKSLDDTYPTRFVQRKLPALTQGYIALHGLLGQEQDLVAAAAHFKNVDENEPVKRIEALLELANICFANNNKAQYNNGLDKLVHIADTYLNNNPEELPLNINSEELKQIEALFKSANRYITEKDKEQCNNALDKLARIADTYLNNNPEELPLDINSEELEQIEALFKLANHRKIEQCNNTLDELVRIADTYLKENPKDKYVADMRTDAMRLKSSLTVKDVNSEEHGALIRIEVLFKSANRYIIEEDKVQANNTLDELITIADTYLKENPEDTYVAEMKTEAEKLITLLASEKDNPEGNKLAKEELERKGELNQEPENNDDQVKAHKLEYRDLVRLGYFRSELTPQKVAEDLEQASKNTVRHVSNCLSVFN